MDKNALKKITMYVWGAMLVMFILIQFFPYGRDHTNPPVLSEPQWDSPQTRELAVRACYDCHSNETVWPWYSNIAPVSWLVYYDVMEGRRKLNFSEWDHGGRESIGEIVEEIDEGEMPPFIYVIMHPKAWFSAEEKQALHDGFLNMR